MKKEKILLWTAIGLTTAVVIAMIILAVYAPTHLISFLVGTVCFWIISSLLDWRCDLVKEIKESTKELSSSEEALKELDDMIESAVLPPSVGEKLVYVVLDEEETTETSECIEKEDEEEPVKVVEEEKPTIEPAKKEKKKRAPRKKK